MGSNPTWATKNTEMLERYLKLLDELILKRKMNLGSLEHFAESKLLEELDSCWRQMTDSEREEAEKRFRPLV